MDDDDKTAVWFAPGKGPSFETARHLFAPLDSLEERKRKLAAPASGHLVDLLLTEQRTRLGRFEYETATRLRAIERQITRGNIAVGVGIGLGVLGVGLTLYQILHQADPQGPTEPVR